MRHDNDAHRLRNARLRRDLPDNMRPRLSQVSVGSAHLLDRPLVDGAVRIHRAQPPNTHVDRVHPRLGRHLLLALSLDARHTSLIGAVPAVVHHAKGRRALSLQLGYRHISLRRRGSMPADVGVLEADIGEVPAFRRRHRAHDAWPRHVGHLSARGRHAGLYRGEKDRKPRPLSHRRTPDGGHYCHRLGGLHPHADHRYLRKSGGIPGLILGADCRDRSRTYTCCGGASPK